MTASADSSVRLTLVREQTSSEAQLMTTAATATTAAVSMSTSTSAASATTTATQGTSVTIGVNSSDANNSTSGLMNGTAASMHRNRRRSAATPSPIILATHFKRNAPAASTTSQSMPPVSSPISVDACAVNACATDVSAQLSAPVSVSVSVPAKTNLTLHVGVPHAQWGGRHELDTLYCAVGIYDTITVTRKTPGSGFSLDLSGEHLGDLASSKSDMRRNHAVLALFALAEEAKRSPDVALHIEKHIPVGAGLGGGSADAAGTLLALNALWELHWPISQLQEIAATLGADMPFCLTGGYAHGSGFGEQICILDDDSNANVTGVLNVTGKSSVTVQLLRERGFCGHLLVGAYHTQLSTPAVYAAFDQLGTLPGDENHLQHAAISLHPRSGDAIQLALDAGASHAFVSGSGPSVVAFTPTSAIAQAVRTAWEQAHAVDRIIAADAPAHPVITVTADPLIASDSNANVCTIFREKDRL